MMYDQINYMTHMTYHQINYNYDPYDVRSDKLYDRHDVRSYILYDPHDVRSDSAARLDLHVRKARTPRIIDPLSIAVILL